MVGLGGDAGKPRVRDSDTCKVDKGNELKLHNRSRNAVRSLKPKLVPWARVWVMVADKPDNGDKRSKMNARASSAVRVRPAPRTNLINAAAMTLGA